MEGSVPRQETMEDGAVNLESIIITEYAFIGCMMLYA